MPPDSVLAPLCFYGLAGAAVLCALLLLFARHPISGALSLIGVMLSLSGLYALLHSPFIAVLQVLVYAGAIMMLLVFVIMVLNQGKDHRVPRFDPLSLFGLALPVVLCLGVSGVLRRTPLSGSEVARPVEGTIEGIAVQMFNLGAGQGWWLLFEVTGLLLLAAVVGAVLLAKRSLDTDESAHAGAAADHAHDSTQALAVVPPAVAVSPAAEARP